MDINRLLIAFITHVLHPFDAMCPSIEQLQGIYDPADPCQGGGINIY